MKIVFRTALLLLGAALFAWFLLRANPEEILQAFSRLGWLLPLVLVPYSLVYVADTLGWHFAFGREHGHRLPFLTLFRIRWSGEAVNNVIPTAYIGGEALKVYLLHKRGVPARNATASVVTGKTVQSLSQVVFICLGALAATHLAVPGSGFRPGLMAVLAGGFGVVAAMFWLQSHGLFTILLRCLRKAGWHWASLEVRAEQLKQIDRQIAGFYLRDRKHFLFSAGAYFSGWLLDVLEIFLVAWLLGQPLTWTQALMVEAFVGVARVLGLFVPGALGVQESGIVFLCRAAGLGDAFGVTYAILRRGRETVYAFVGWLLLYLEEASLSGLAGRIALNTKNQI